MALHETVVGRPRRVDDLNASGLAGSGQGMGRMGAAGFQRRRRAPADNRRVEQSSATHGDSTGTSTPVKYLDGSDAGLRSSIFEERSVRLHHVGDDRRWPGHFYFHLARMDHAKMSMPVWSWDVKASRSG